MVRVCGCVDGRVRVRVVHVIVDGSVIVRVRVGHVW